MEFPAGTVTNFHVIDDIVTLYCRLYCTKSSASGPGEPNGHAESLEAAALTLRNAGCLVAVIPNARGMWLFSEGQDFHALRSLPVSTDEESFNVIQVDGFEFHNCVFGAISISDFAKRFLSDPTAGLLLSGIFKSQIPDEFALSPPVQSMTTFYVLYRSFISAVAGLLILRATLRYGAIPLGRRTLFTATEPDGYEGGGPSPSIGSSSFLSTLNIDITNRGKLLISWKSTPQPGLEQCSSNQPSGNRGNSSQFNEDIWIAPSGTIGRYISTVEPETTPTAQTGLWKQAVRSWLQKYGMDFNRIETQAWLEIEMVNPLCHQGITVRTDENGGNAPSSSSRVLWPAKLCFRRAKTEQSSEATGFFKNDVDSPLQFAERWMADSVSKRVSAIPARLGNKAQDGQSKVLPPITTSNRDVRQNITSLARTIHYPDANLAIAVYPTPPDAVLPPQLAPAITSEGFDPVASYVMNTAQERQGPYPLEDVPPTSLCGDADTVMADLDVHSSQLGMGPGMYDTAADDLFGDLDEDFGTKEITEADFNFFDEPDIGELQESDSSMQPLTVGSADEGPAAEVRSEQTTKPMELSVPNMPGIENSHPSGPFTDTQSTDIKPTTKPDTVGHDVDAATVSAPNVPEPGESRSSSPPLSPSGVKDILFARGVINSGRLEPSGKDTRVKQEGGYNAVPFKQTLGSSDQKYQRDGRFWFRPSEEKASQGAKPRGYPEDIPVLGLTRKRAVLRPENNVRGPWDDQKSPSSSSDESSDEESPLSVMVSEASSPSSGRANAERQRSPAVGPETAKSPQPSAVDTESLLIKYTSFVGDLISTSTYWSLAGYFSRRKSDVAPALTQVEGLIQVAQLVVDQLTQSSFQHGIDGITKRTDDDDVSYHYQHIDTAGLLDKGRALNLRGYLTMEDPSNPAGQRKDVRIGRPNTGGLFKLIPPHVRLRRGNDFLETLPPAVSFWETFGLEPLLGPKDVVSFCIYPSATRDQADAFLGRLGSTYQSANLGMHSRPSIGDGLVPWSVNSSGDRGYKTIMHNLQRVCEDLGTNLSALPRSDENIVVYIVNPFSHGAALADICTSFVRLFHQYVEESPKQQVRHFNELVLQIVPLPFVASTDSLIVPPQSEYMRLALEVYSRCAPKGCGVDWTGCAPPVVLAEPNPRIVSLKLSSDGASPLEDGRFFHLAYSYSLDRRWITAAWTDYAGRYQTNMSYCLRERGSSISRPIVEVLADIWGATQDIFGLSNRLWRIVIAKDDLLEREELAAWTTFAQKHNQTRQAKVELTILHVEINPSLTLKVPSSPAQLSALSQLAQPSQGSSTPVSTPKPGVASPEPCSNTSTPYPTSNLQTSMDQQPPPSQHQVPLHAPSHAQQPPQQPPQQQQQQQHLNANPTPNNDQDQVLLIDKSDETWAITLSHRINTSQTLNTYRPAHSSGYLLRRRGISDVDGFASLAVNVMYTQVRIPADLILKDVMRTYRDLTTLARMRGFAFAQGSSPLPWHIATAVRGQEALSYIL